MYTSKIDQEISFSIEESQYTFIGKKITAHVYTSVWLRSVFTSFILRSDSKNTLANAPEEVFLNANIRPDKIDLILIDLFKRALNDDLGQEVQTKIDQVLTLIAAKDMEAGRLEYREKIIIPLLNLFHSIGENNSTDFNSGLSLALTQHKVFWSNPKNQDDYFGWISIPLLACLFYRF